MTAIAVLSPGTTSLLKETFPSSIPNRKIFLFYSFSLGLPSKTFTHSLSMNPTYILIHKYQKFLIFGILSVSYLMFEANLFYFKDFGYLLGGGRLIPFIVNLATPLVYKAKVRMIFYT